MALRIRWGRVFGAVGAVGLAFAGARWLLGPSVDVLGQAWLERVPRNDRDRVAMLILIDDGGEKVGGLSVASMWQRQLDLFLWSREGARYTLHFPQDEHRAVVDLRAYRCEGKAPQPFTLCLDVTAPDGRKRTLYSSEDLRVGEPSATVDLPYDAEGSEVAGAPLPRLVGR